MNDSHDVISHDLLPNPSHEKAIEILTGLQNQLGSAPLAYWITPNAILTLSGARAYCDGVFKSDDENVLNAWANEMKDSLKLLESLADTPYTNAGTDDSLSGGRYAGYGILTLAGMEYSLKKTELVKDVDEIIEKRLASQELYDAIAMRLKQNSSLKNISDENIAYFMQGILLGYPDKAIMGCLNKWGPEELPYEEQLVDANIIGADIYHCPLPVYLYPRNLSNDPDIKTHEKLWSSILTNFYESDFHKSLTKDPEFQARAHELGLYEKF